MRARYSVLYVLIYVLGVLTIADVWLPQRLRTRLDQRVVISVAVAVLLLLTALVQGLITRSVRRSAQRSADLARVAEETAAEERARLTADIHATIAERIHAIVVEVVAAHQAVVRGAYGDDVLTRLTGADDNAHAALESLDRLLPSPTTSSTPSSSTTAEAPLPVA